MERSTLATSDENREIVAVEGAESPTKPGARERACHLKHIVIGQISAIRMALIRMALFENEMRYPRATSL